MAVDFSNLEQLFRSVIDHCFRLQNDVGPGLLESAYEAFLAASLREAGFGVEQQVGVTAHYANQSFENAFRIDILVERKLIIEIKSVEQLLPVHKKQVLTYLRFTRLPVGLLINFNSALFTDGVQRVIDNRHPYKPPRA